MNKDLDRERAELSAGVSMFDGELLRGADPLRDRAAEEVISRLEKTLAETKEKAEFYESKYNQALEKKKIAEDKARYWKDKYDKALHDYLELEKAAEKCSGELMTLKERFAEVIAENHILKQSVFFGNDKRAHDIALAALKMEWKKGEIHHQNDSRSMGYYLAAYKYALEQLEADQNKD